MIFFWIGTVADLVIGLGLEAESTTIKWVFVIVGIICIGSGTAIYVGADMGSGPRDGVMVGLESRGIKIGLARNIIEVTVFKFRMAFRWNSWVIFCCNSSFNWPCCSNSHSIF